MSRLRDTSASEDERRRGPGGRSLRGLAAPGRHGARLRPPAAEVRSRCRARRRGVRAGLQPALPRYAGWHPRPLLDHAHGDRSPSSPSARRSCSASSGCTRSGGATSSSLTCGRSSARPRWRAGCWLPSSRSPSPTPTACRARWSCSTSCSPSSCVGGGRLARRMIAERPDRAARRRRTRGVLVVGAGSGGQMVVRELRLNPRLGAARDRLRGRRPAQAGHARRRGEGAGSTDEIDEILDRKSPDEVIIAIPSAPGVLRAKVVAACREREIPVRTLPTVFELLRGGVQLTRQLREVRVEDVLGRDPVVMELERVGAYLDDKIVHGHRRRRLGRRRALPPDRSRGAQALGAARPRRGQPVSDRPRDARRMALHPGRGGAGRLQGGGPDAGGDAALQAGCRLPRRRLQARAADGGESARGGAQQRDRHSRHRGNGRGGRRGAVRADLH